MKIKLLQALTIAYFLLVFALFKTFDIFPTIFLIIVLLLDYFTDIRSGVKNLLYLLAALSVITPLLGIFLIYLPFAVFGLLLTKRSFVKNYVLGFAISFIPSNLIYLITTYLSIPLNFPTILVIFYAIPLIPILILNKKSIKFFEVDNKECIFILIVLFFTTIVAINIISDKNLFMANGVRVFTRVNIAAEGLRDYGLIPIYNPKIAQGEITYLWSTPSFHTHAALAHYLLGKANSILFFNIQSFFILFLSTLSLGLLFKSLISGEESSINTLIVTSVTVSIGLNFYFLQLLESFQQNYSYPIAYLLLSIILDNPKKFEDFVVLMYASVTIITIHLPYGAGVLVLAACLFLILKISDLRNENQINQLIKWIFSNKLKFFITLAIIFLLPLFYIAPSFIYKDFFTEMPRRAINYYNTKTDVVNFFKGFFYNEAGFVSLRYPDVNRIDDHKFGFLVSVFGVFSFFFLLIMYKLKGIKNFRIFASAFIINLIILSLIAERMSIRLGGFYRTTGPYLLILFGISMLTFIHLFKSKYLKYGLTAVVFIGFMHTIPYAGQNITNIHKEMFAGGEIYKNELDFIRQLPIDGRIMTYGLFSNVVDFGGGYLTGRYFSRNERIEFAIERNIWEKVHSQNSFGEPDVVLTKSGTELSNYLILGGYKYLFLNACHPIGNFVVSVLYPNFSYPINQNNCLLFLVINNTNYAEKVDIVGNIDNETYKKKDGYKYTTISKYHGFAANNITFVETPRNPQPLKFERLSSTKVNIFGDFNDNDFVVFKESYFPRWKAYMGGKEIQVLANNHDLILIKTIKGKNILLEFSVTNKEKIFGILSLLALLGLIVLLVFLLIQTSKNI